MDSSALYSDIVLPAATYYEKNDLNSTDMHTFIHPLQAAVPPCWEARNDWDIFKEIARETARLADRHLPEPVKDIVISPLQHDTPAEMAQPTVKDWSRGECEAIPGKTMPGMSVVTRNYRELYKRFISLGRNYRDKGLAVHGTHYDIDDVYDEYMMSRPVETWNDTTYPSLSKDVDVCNAILAFAAETNGELAYRAYEAESKKTGIDHTHLAADTRAIRMTFEDIINQPRRVLTTPYWTGITNDGRAYTSYAQNVEELIPWRTLTGRQHLYLDHETYRAFGEHLPTHKPRPRPARCATSRRLRPVNSPRAQLPHAPRQVAHPLHLWRHPAHGDPLARHRALLDERQGRRDDRHRGQRLGRGHQRPRRRVHTRVRQRPAASRNGNDLSRDGADAVGAEVARPRRAASWRPQQPDARAPEAALHDRRVRAVHLRLQLLGTDGRQPRHLRHRPQDGQGRVLRGISECTSLTSNPTLG
ncbi:MAG: molybdopterin-dependent oxidoreductase [Blastocatellia bacterium]|nr:molybdopterin-dependent oxidoreductase [Blastocatellia bacterium]